MAKKLNAFDYQELKSNYIQKMLYRDIPLYMIERYISKDVDNEKQATKMLKEVQAEYKQANDDSLDLVIFEILEVLRQPTKWAVDANFNIIKAFPHPILNSDRRITGIEYKPYKSYYFTDDELFSRYCTLMDEIEAGAKVKPVKKKDITAPIVKEWEELKQHGLSYRQIGDRYDVKKSSVKYRLDKLKEEQKAGA